MTQPLVKPRPCLALGSVQPVWGTQPPSAPPIAALVRIGRPSAAATLESPLPPYPRFAIARLIQEDLPFFNKKCLNRVNAFYVTSVDAKY